MQRFQSLLSWIRVLNAHAVPRLITPPPSFNPCCPGFGSSTTVGIRSVLGIGRFQSLLSWIRVLNMIKPTIGRVVLVLVSILVVLDSGPQPEPMLPRMCSRAGFQSLLSWIRVLNYAG